MPTELSTPQEKASYERWERSNRLSMMLIKAHVGKSIRGSIPDCAKVKDYLNAIKQQFETSNKAMASTLMSKLSSMKFTATKGMGEHIMEMRDIGARLKSLEIEISESFLGFLNHRKPMESEGAIYSGNKMPSRVEAVGTYKLVLNSGFILDLDKTFYIPSFSRNLVLVSRLLPFGFGFNFLGTTFHLLKDSVIVGDRILNDGYMTIERIKRLANDGVLETLDFTDFEAKNARFIENDGISWSSQPRNIVFEEDQSSKTTPDTSDYLVVVQQFPQPAAEEPHHEENIPEDLAIQQPSQDDADIALRRSTRTKKPTIPSDYVVYLQEYDVDIGAEDDPTSFSQATCNDILLASSDLGLLHEVKRFLSQQFDMKDMGEATYVIGIKIQRDISQGILGLSQETYINKLLERFRMKDCSPSVAPIVKGDKFSLKQCLENKLQREQMTNIPYTSVVGSLIYAQVCTRPDIAYAVGMLGRYQSNPDSNFAGCSDTRKSTLGYVFLLAEEAISYRRAKQSLIATSTTEAEFVSCFEATTQVIWLRSFISGLEIVDSISRPLKIYCDNSAAVFLAKNNKSGSRSKHIDIKY
ncbi:hypothetical protein KPL71_001044 [Citrus sinensis]|uniref:Uncharacterized protein n=1 Tax=Citrus sinensis TaxID=2711 RepID=A0ACB8NUH7_CITSI|nr:hypothetical protein KPL71_001044 [Citrus sinensis]